MKQTTKRKHVVFLLYMSEFYEKEDLDEQIDLYFKSNAEEETVKDDELCINEFFENGLAEELKNKYLAVREKLGVIDAMIAGVSDGWKLDRMGKVDLAIMRMAVYEIFFDDVTPSPVAISEAVLLAKSYGGDNSSSTFINGILGRLERNRQSNE